MRRTSTWVSVLGVCVLGALGALAAPVAAQHPADQLPVSRTSAVGAPGVTGAGMPTLPYPSANQRRAGVPVTATSPSRLLSGPDTGTKDASAPGVQWRLAAADPVERYGQLSMVYDEARRNIVLLTGSGGGGPADTWTWGGDHWTQATGAGPPDRAGASMVYDAAKREVVLFGGTGVGQAPLGDTWTWNGTRWAQFSGAGPPAQGSSAPMVYDAARRQVVLFATVYDQATDAYRGETWIWSGGRWKQLAGDGPAGRLYASMVYDPATGQIVLTGGRGRSEHFGDTWTFDGQSWTQRSVVQLPARINASMVYDAASGRVVLFGGESNTSYLGDSWTWDGLTWTQQASGTGVGAGPGPRGGASMVYDASTRQVVLFGGANANGYLDDTWTWAAAPGASGSGTDEVWSRASSGPRTRRDANMVYDAAARQVVLFGGAGDDSSFQVLGDTWTRTGQRWTSRGGPPTEPDQNVVYDAARRQVVLFGGFNETVTFLRRSDYPGGTWLWAGKRWIQRTVGTQPPARVGARMVYDEARRQVVLFGGYHLESYQALGDTWVWDGRGWSQRKSGAAPPARYNPSMVYDTARRQVVLFGGFDGSNWLGDTWTWDGAGWTQRQAGSATATPSPREAPSLAYDDATQQVVLFGGKQASPGGPLPNNVPFGTLDNGRGALALGDTWLWNGTAWTEAGTGGPLGSGPPARYDAGMAYDPAAKRTLLFGGTGNPGSGSGWTAILGDSWTWDGKTWTQVSAAAGPPPRKSPSMVYDAASRQMMLFGGSGDTGQGYVPGVVDFDSPLGDTWTWDGKTWLSRTSAAAPPPQPRASMVYDAARGRIVLFGPRRATWTW